MQGDGYIERAFRKEDEGNSDFLCNKDYSGMLELGEFILFQFDTLC